MRVMSGSGVIWFVTVDMGEPAPTVSFPYWGNPFHSLIDMVEGYDNNGFWED
jgi:hypothetical protein